MNIKLVISLFAILLVVSVEGKKTGRSRGSGSGRGSSKKTNSNPQPAPTSFSYPQPAQKPSLSGWQERPAQKTKTSDSHSYPSSGTGLSGNKPKQTPTNQESIQRSSASSNLASQQGHTNNNQGHSYPASTGLSGGAGNGYPQQNSNKNPQHQSAGNVGNSQSGYPQSPGSGLSGGGQPGNGYPQQQGQGLSGNAQSGHSYPTQHGQPQHSSGSGYPQQVGGGYNQAPPPYSGYRPGQANMGQNNYGSNNYHPQGPPPPYSNVGSYGGYGGHNSYGPGYGSQMPGYFGNNGKGYGGVSRTRSALTGVGIAGAGIGTVLTGLALWNLARSTGRSQHTVIYDNRGQPVAVAAGNDTAAEDSMLADLLNCSLTISNDNKTEVLAIPCAIATSFSPEADVKDAGINENANDNTKCTITVLTKSYKEYMTTIPCSILLNTAAENNVTEPIIENEPVDISNSSIEADHLKGGDVVNTTAPNEPTALRLTGSDTDVNSSTFSNLNCTPHLGETVDPINPCYSVTHNLTVIPLPTTPIPN